MKEWQGGRGTGRDRGGGAMVCLRVWNGWQGRRCREGCRGGEDNQGWLNRYQRQEQGVGTRGGGRGREGIGSAKQGSEVGDDKPYFLEKRLAGSGPQWC